MWPCLALSLVKVFCGLLASHPSISPSFGWEARKPVACVNLFGSLNFIVSAERATTAAVSLNCDLLRHIIMLCFLEYSDINSNPLWFDNQSSPEPVLCGQNNNGLWVCCAFAILCEESIEECWQVKFPSTWIELKLEAVEVLNHHLENCTYATISVYLPLGFFFLVHVFIYERWVT